MADPLQHILHFTNTFQARKLLPFTGQGEEYILISNQFQGKF